MFDNQSMVQNESLLNTLRSHKDLKIMFQIDKIGGYVSKEGDKNIFSFVDGIEKVYITTIYSYQDAIYKASDYGELFGDVEKNLDKLENESDDEYETRITEFINNNIDKEDVIVVEIKNENEASDGDMGMLGGLLGNMFGSIGNEQDETTLEVNDTEEGE